MTLGQEFSIQVFNPGHAQEEKHRKYSDHTSRCCVCLDALKASDVRLLEGRSKGYLDKTCMGALEELLGLSIWMFPKAI